MVKRNANGIAHYEWVQRGKNEALDVRVYALGCISVAYGERARQLAEADEAAGLKPRTYTWAHFWNEVEARKRAISERAKK